MKKNTRRIILKTVLSVAIFVAIFWTAQSILQAKWLLDEGDNTASTGIWTEYRRMEDDTLDVLYIGTSHMLYGIDAMYMYDISGITGFTLNGPGLRMDLSYLVLQDALKTQSPEVVVFDVSALHYVNQQRESSAHKVSDQLPTSLGKIYYAFNNGNDELDPLGILFPFFRYHTRWSALSKSDFLAVTDGYEETYVRGHNITYEQTEARFTFYDEDEEFTVTESNIEYLKQMAELCQENGIELILCKIPTPDWTLAVSEGVADAAAECGLSYWEMYYDIEEIGIDAETDFKDDTDHLNQVGAEKLCTYLTSWLQEQYGFEDHRGQEGYEEWDEGLEWYLEYKQGKIDEYNESAED